MTIFNHFNDVFSALWIYILTRWQHSLKQNHKKQNNKITYIMRCATYSVIG